MELVGAPSIDWLGVPLLRGERAVGALAVQSYDEAVRFDEGDLEMLTFVSRHVASALDKVRGRDALRESETRFRALAETAPCAIFIYQGTQIVYANAAEFTEPLRYTSEGFMNGINAMQGSSRRWTSERPFPDRVVFRLAIPSRLG